MSDMVSISDYFHYEMFSNLKNGQGETEFWGHLCNVQLTET